MLLWTLFLGTALTAPTDEFHKFSNSMDQSSNDEPYVREIVPGLLSVPMNNYIPKIPHLKDKDNKNFISFYEHYLKGHILKGLTFNIYDDNMQAAAISLFRLLQEINDEECKKLIEWAETQVNDDLIDYVLRLLPVYSNKFIKKHQEPPFITNPHYFVNSETIAKALKLKINQGYFNEQESNINQYFRQNDVIAINTNYSSWNLFNTDCQKELNYFREDIGLNSYYYGMYVKHPHWMSNDELEEMNPRFTEHYYYDHQQLLARYQLEKERLKGKESSTKCDSFDSYLGYENGLPFPKRISSKSDWSDDKAKLTAIDIAIRECIERGIIIMESGQIISITDENHVLLLSKLIRANFDAVNTAKIVRSVYGYGVNNYFKDMYSPAPSVLHHPQTTLRDPIYWNLIQTLVSYFSDAKSTVTPYNISRSYNGDFAVIDLEYSEITTLFQHYQFNINNALGNKDKNLLQQDLIITSRQKRLQHNSFTMNFSVDSVVEKDVIVRLFLGPQCQPSECWNNNYRFFNLDNFESYIEKGSNIISWSPKDSDNFSFDDYYNEESKYEGLNKYTMFKYPENLLIPQGTEDGLNFTLFIIITQNDHKSKANFTPKSSFYKHVSKEIDEKPLGFPFHMPVVLADEIGYNYKFFNVTIFHDKQNVEGEYFSPNLD